jgi:DNA mismatch repair protein MutS
MIALSQLTHITPYINNKYMLLDSYTRRNLELTETLREKNKRGSLLWVLDKTKTAMGARTLRLYTEQPLLDVNEINSRLDAIGELCDKNMDRDEIREYLGAIYDLERLLTKISYRSINPRDMIAFKTSLKILPPIKDQLNGFDSELLKSINTGIDGLEDICGLIEDSIIDEPPLSSKEGGFIKEGYDENIDLLRRSKTEGKQWLFDLEEEERNRTGIKNLKIKYNKVFGYYIEVTNSNKDMVPEDYIRKQTLVNGERFVTEELKNLESQLLTARDRLNELEYRIFKELSDAVAAMAPAIRETAEDVATLDALASLAETAVKNSYCLPEVDLSGIIDIRDGRHPVVEQMLSDGVFVANDARLDAAGERASIITGPNMAGKSTYMRQTALIVLMAQIGSFVPARSAHIGIADRIFTRIGASDDLAAGQSTFMVEMMEVADILKNATKSSLIILDEVGRGTSTYDGMSIARAVLEFCADPRKLGARTMFATHYHELTELEQTLPGVKNLNTAVKKRGEDVIFLRRIVPGGADRSYGVEVAKLAGVPDSVIRRAKAVLLELEKHAVPISFEASEDLPEPEESQLSLGSLGAEQAMDKLRDLDINTLTPLEAMNILFELKKLLREE